MFPTYYDPHYRRDRDHKKIVADNRRYEKRIAELKAGLAWIATKKKSNHDDKPPEKLFSELRAAESRTVWAIKEKLRIKLFRKFNGPKGRKRKKTKNAQKAKKAPKQIQSNLNLTEESVIKSRPASELIMEIQEIESIIGKWSIDFANEQNIARKRLLGERLFHKRTKRSKLYEELYEIGHNLIAYYQSKIKNPDESKPNEDKSLDKKNLLDPNYRVRKR